MSSLLVSSGNVYLFSDLHLTFFFFTDGVIQNADPAGKNAHCNWTWDGCVKPTDIVHCTDKTIWGTVS